MQPHLGFLDYVGAGLGAIAGLAVAAYVIACVVAFFIGEGFWGGLKLIAEVVGSVALILATGAGAIGAVAGLGWLVVNLPLFIMRGLA